METFCERNFFVNVFGDTKILFIKVGDKTNEAITFSEKPR